MSAFTIKVVLHSAVWPSNYDLLHERMEAAGYLRTLTSDTGKSYHNTPATYTAVWQGISTQDVHSHVARVIGQLGLQPPGIMVERVEDRVWSGLVEVPNPASTASAVFGLSGVTALAYAPSASAVGRTGSAVAPMLFQATTNSLAGLGPGGTRMPAAPLNSLAAALLLAPDRR